MEKVRVGVVGCGNISGIYLKNMTGLFDILDVKACTDLVPERAQAAAEEYGIEAVTPEKLYADPEIEIILNITIPQAHHAVAMKAVDAGKCVHGEKPITLTRGQGKELLAAAKAKGVLVGNAPDTFMGGGIQTCRKLIDDGWIGDPIAATAFMLCPGHESWHPDPEFYYHVGGGPMLDMGPYYLTALVSLMGPVRRVTGSARITHPERTITSEKKYGKKIRVEVPTHVAGILDFADGAIATLVTSFDVHAHTTPHIEIYGTQGTLLVPDPNTFGGPVKVKRAGAEEWSEIPLTHIHTENSRGIAVADMAYALRTGRPHRATGEMAYHVLDIMHAVHDASATGVHVDIESTCSRPAPLPTDLLLGRLDG